MKNAAWGQGPKHSHQQENVRNIQARGGVWVEHSTSTPAPSRLLLIILLYSLVGSLIFSTFYQGDGRKSSRKYAGWLIGTDDWFGHLPSHMQPPLHKKCQKNFRTSKPVWKQILMMPVNPLNAQSLCISGGTQKAVVAWQLLREMMPERSWKRTGSLPSTKQHCAL